MRSSPVIIKNNQILLIHRIKPNEEYYVLPGGSVEPGETVEQAAIREAKEETNLDIVIDRKLWEYKDERDGRVGHYFLVTQLRGDLQLNSPEKERNREGNRYFLEWHELEEIGALKLLPEEIKEKIKHQF